MMKSGVFCLSRNREVRIMDSVMKVYDIIDKRETPAKKYTIAHEGTAYDLACKYCGKSLYLHLPTIEGESAVVKWYGTDEPAVIVKPARVIASDSVADIVRRVYINAKGKAKEAEARFDEEKSEFNKYQFIEAVAVLDGVFEVAEALGMIDGRGGYGKL